MVKTDYNVRQPDGWDYPSTILKEQIYEIEITSLNGGIWFKVLMKRQKNGKEIFESEERQFFPEYQSIFKIVQDLHVGQRMRIKIRTGSNWESVELLYAPDADNTIIPCS